MASAARMHCTAASSACSRLMLGWALFVWLSQEIERLNFGRKDSRLLRLLHRELAAAEDVAAALLKE